MKLSLIGGFFGAIKYLLGIGSSRYEEDYDDEVLAGDDLNVATRKTAAAAAKRRRFSLRLYKRHEEDIVLKFPKNLNDAKEIADHLKEKYVVIMNLSEAGTSDSSRQILDFMYGVAYALDAHIERVGVAEPIFVLTPMHRFIIKNEHAK